MNSESLKPFDYPLVTKHGRFPETPVCRICGGSFSAGHAYLSGGAVADAYDLPEDALGLIGTGFFHVGYHGRTPKHEIGVGTTVFDEVAHGQFELQFCSLKCLKTWFVGVIDDLEREAGF